VDEEVGGWSPGDGAARAGQLAGDAVARAVALAQAGVVDGVVTAPLDKAALHAGGWDYPGHTEMLAALTGRATAMMLAATRPSAPGGTPLRVVLATTHVPLRDVPRLLTREAILEAAAVTRDGLRAWFGIAEPRIALCALNPHAGDGGRFGRDDDECSPRPPARRGSPDPFPRHGVRAGHARRLRRCDRAVSRRGHDGDKVAAFGHAVNVTSACPSRAPHPTTATALDIAGQGIADPSSFLDALASAPRSQPG
jgi:4-hydroxythreonine-4-phosphate dehydrogenase